MTAVLEGHDARVPVLGGGTRRFVHLDHAASTPPLIAALERVRAAAPWYANVHRGAGFKSRWSTWAYEQARERVLAFCGADPAGHAAVFTRNTTAALNLLSRTLPLERGDVVLVTGMEHHSNDLPWRRVARVVHAPLAPDGTVDEDALHGLLRAHAGHVAVLAVTGASNVTGVLNPVRRWAAWAHAAGARIVVDAAQLAPHQPFGTGEPDDPEHLDAVAFSGHKLYAPFGVGVLVATRDCFGEAPVEAGGGTVDVVDFDRVRWTDLPEREEAGTPCVLGALALETAITALDDLRHEGLAHRARSLVALAMARLAAVPGLTLYGPRQPDRRVGVLSFNLAGRPHGLVAAMLGAEHAIGVRSGCFCAHPYVKSLLGMDDAASRRSEAAILAGDRRDMPGAVRASFGIATTPEDVERLVCALTDIAAGRHADGYVQDRHSGEWSHPDEPADFAGWLEHQGRHAHA